MDCAGIQKPDGWYCAENCKQRVTHASDTLIIGDSTVTGNKWSYDSCAIPGATLGEIIGKCEFDQHTRVIISVGVNDALGRTDLGEFYEQYGHLVKNASLRGRDVIVNTIPSYETPNDRIDQFNDVITLVAQEKCAKMLVLNDLQQSDSDDGLHPNKMGYEKWLKKLKKL